jgi:hypothetical protein
MIRRLLSTLSGGYRSTDLLWRNIGKWMPRRGGWIVNGLIFDEVFTLRCMRALDPAAKDFGRMLTRRMNWAMMDLKGGWA